MPHHRAKWRYIAINTEYLGTVHGVPARAVLSLTMHNYALVKANIDELPALQLELTICDEDDNLLVVIKNDDSPCNSPRSSTSMTSKLRMRLWRH
jgi:CCR4-NOT transcription complex subunit 7/8